MIRKQIFIMVLMLMAACTTAPPVKKESAPEKMALPAGGYRAFAVREGAHIRNRPGTQGAVVRTTRDGEEFVVSENKNGWLRIKTIDNKEGWIRSDFAGPENLSYARKSSAFLDGTLKKYNAELFIDKKKPYRVIYLVLESGYYKSVAQAAKRARVIGRAYQKEVWPGRVEIRVMKADKKTLFTRVTLPAIDAAGLKPPVLKQGRLYSMEVNNRKLYIQALVPASMNHKQLLAMADDIAGSYGDAIRRVDIVLVADTPAGLSWCQNGATAADNSPCMLYYFEDAQGSDYSFNRCPEKK